MADRLEPSGLDGVLVRWGTVWIRAEVLERIRVAVEREDVHGDDLAGDVAAELQKVLSGRLVYRVEELPARVRKLLGL